jgi:hypothetical protein
MKIVVLCEGETEAAFRDALLAFVEQCKIESGVDSLRNRIAFRKRDKAVPSGEKLYRIVENILAEGDVKAVVVLKDMYPEYRNISPSEARNNIMKDLTGLPNVFAAVARHDFEACLLPFWSEIQRRTGRNTAPLSSQPEDINDNAPPAHRLSELYQAAHPHPKKYKKPSEAKAILHGKDLRISAAKCPEFKHFLNIILRLSDLPELPK